MKNLFHPAYISAVLIVLSSAFRPTSVQAAEKTPENTANFIFDRRDDLSDFVWSLYASDAQGKTTKLGSLPYATQLYDISLDNQWVLCGTNATSANSGDIYKAHLDGSEVQRLTFTARNNSRAVFSPDGKQIVFQANGSHAKKGEDWTDWADVWIMNADGSNQRNLTPRVGTQTDPAFSPDGTKIYFQEGSDAIHSMNTNGRDIRLVAKAQGGILKFVLLPDSENLIYAAKVYGAPTQFFAVSLLKTNKDNVGKNISVASGDYFCFSRDKRNLHVGFFRDNPRKFAFYDVTLNGLQTPETSERSPHNDIGLQMQDSALRGIQLPVPLVIP